MDGLHHLFYCNGGHYYSRKGDFDLDWGVYYQKEGIIGREQLSLGLRAGDISLIIRCV